MKNILKIASIVFLFSCGAKKSMVMSQADADRGAAKFPGTTLASLTQGKNYYEQHCQSCHGLYTPASHSEEKWRVIVPEMVKKANKKSGAVSVPIDAATEESMLRYLITMGSAPTPSK